MHGRAALRDDCHGNGQIAPTITIGLLWHSLNSGNLGIGALTLANLAIARDAARRAGLTPRFVIMGARESAPPPFAGLDIQCVAIDSRALKPGGAIWRAMGEVDCVLDIGAGDSFTDIYGPRRFLFLTLTKLFALARGRPLVLSPQTIGPFTGAGYKAIAAFIMRRSRAVFARDEASRVAALSLAPEANVKLAVDVAFELPFTDRASLRGSPLLRIGVNVSGLLFGEAERGTNHFGLSYDYAVFTRRLLSALTRQPSLQVHLIPHATNRENPVDDDGVVADRLAREFPTAIRVPDFADPTRAKSYISGLDLLVAGRMHACIAAFSTGVPVVPVAYSRKFTGLFGLLDYDMMIPVKSMDEDAAVACVMQALGSRLQLAAAEVEGLAKVETLLAGYRATLSGLFASVSQRS